MASNNQSAPGIRLRSSKIVPRVLPPIRPARVRREPSAMGLRQRRGGDNRGQHLKPREAHRIGKRWPANIRLPRILPIAIPVQALSSVGLDRPAQTCYRRAVLQCLLHIPRFLNLLNINHECCWNDECNLCNMIDLSFSYWMHSVEVDTAAIHLDNSFNLAWRRDPTDEDQRMDNIEQQQDAFDYFRALLDVMVPALTHDAPQPIEYQRISQKLWTLKDRTEATQSCGHFTRATNDTKMGILVYSKASDSNDMMELIATRMTEDNQVKCKVAGCGSDSRRETTQYTSLPMILVVQIQRIDYDVKKEAMVKVNKIVEYPEELDLQPFVRRGFRGETRYRLNGVVAHRGREFDVGHYVAFVKQPSERVAVIDDDDCHEFPDGDEGRATLLGRADQGDPYLLFYSRI